MNFHNFIHFLFCHKKVITYALWGSTVPNHITKALKQVYSQESIFGVGYDDWTCTNIYMVSPNSYLMCVIVACGCGFLAILCKNMRAIAHGVTLAWKVQVT